MKLKHFFTGMALLCFALSACGAKAETAEETTTAVSSTEEQGEAKAQAAETLEAAFDNGNLADTDASALSDETAATTPPYLYGC